MRDQLSAATIGRVEPGRLVERAIEVVRETARGEGNLMVPMREALRARATIGEISNALRDEFGMYDAQR